MGDRYNKSKQKNKGRISEHDVIYSASSRQTAVVFPLHSMMDLQSLLNEIYQQRKALQNTSVARHKFRRDGEPNKDGNRASAGHSERLENSAGSLNKHIFGPTGLLVGVTLRVKLSTLQAGTIF